ncbi:MAG: RcpC/CpaB family pilus assembly protein [Oscillospiraceae bacterium]|nr:RcpC/CpaB family pilus assembly protein [Oscillospiraceae bacterium]
MSGKLKNGDIVSILVTEKDGGIAEIPPELTYIRVITATSSNGNDAEQIAQDEENNEQPSTVTLLVNEAQGKLLAGYEKSVHMHIALVCRDDEAKAEKLLNSQKKVFSKRKAEDSNG